MYRFNAFIQKDFRHILRDRRTLLILFGMPIMQILLFGFVLTNEIKNAAIAVLDPSEDMESVALTNKQISSGYFHLETSLDSLEELDAAFRAGTIKMAIVFPPNFAKQLPSGGQPKLIAREKELVTMEVLLISPPKPIQIILGKTAPYLVLHLQNALVVVLLGIFVFGMPMRGSVVLLASECLLHMFVTRSLGIHISTKAKDQMMAVFLLALGLVMPTMLISGFIFPRETMPIVAVE